MTGLQLTEAKLVGCGGSSDINKFKFTKFAKWLILNLPLMHYKEDGFNLPGTTAEMNSSYYIPATPNRLNFHLLPYQ